MRCNFNGFNPPQILLILYIMKNNSILIVALLAPFILFCQRPFAPIGAQWGGIVQCSPTLWPCPPDYPYYYNFEVTEDTVVQGKYCTLINERDWGWDGGGYERFIVHQDGHQIYRYDREAEDFKLVLDFSKNAGESWQIEVPDYWAGTDTFTITVTEKDGDYRNVSIDGDWQLFSDLPLYEGFGGLAHNKRLLVGDELFITVDPIIWDELTCYIDPVEGLLYGSASGCVMTNTSNPELEEVEFNLYPNPASSHIKLDCNHTLSTPAVWRLSDALGQTIINQSLLPGSKSNSFSVEELPNGIYFWEVQSDERIIGAGKVMVMKQ